VNPGKDPYLDAGLVNFATLKKKPRQKQQIVATPPTAEGIGSQNFRLRDQLNQRRQ
jgi:hypothetical protein